MDHDLNASLRVPSVHLQHDLVKQVNGGPGQEILDLPDALPAEGLQKNIYIETSKTEVLQMPSAIEENLSQRLN